MAITNYSQIRMGGTVLVTVASDLTPDPDEDLYYHWYLDGLFVATTLEPSYAFVLELNEQARIEVLDTLDPDFDPIANAPAGYSARRRLWWLRSLDTDVASYRVQQQIGAGEWTDIGSVNHGAAWTYSFISPRLSDLTEHTWRIRAVDRAGNLGDPIEVNEEKVVRRPDAPAFTVTFDPGTTRVEFAAA